MTAEGWWGDYGSAHKNDGPADKGQKQAPVAPAKPADTRPSVITAPKIKFGAHRG